MNDQQSMNPYNLDPELLSQQLGPFGSWPDEGLPQGYFSSADDPDLGPFYQEQGFAVLHEAFDSSALREIMQEAVTLSWNEDSAIRGIEAADPSLSDIEVLRKVLCIHFQHKLSEVFHRALSAQAIVDVLTKVIGPNVKCMQSMLFLKASGKPGQAWHQDEDFIPTRDRSLTGAWIALDDATVENGCLWVLPGSHRPGVLWPQKIHFDERFDCTHESFGYPYRDEDSVPVEMKAGSVVFFNGYLLHRSLQNRSKGAFRRALVNHYMSAESLIPWQCPEPTRIATLDYRDIVLVAGEDPYAWKGTTEVAAPHVRAAGDGGCADWTDEGRAQSKALADQVGG